MSFFDEKFSRPRIEPREQKPRNLLGKPIRSHDQFGNPTADRYRVPILRDFDRWQIQNFAYGFGKAGEEIMKQINDHPYSLRVPRATGVIDYSVYDSRGKLLPQSAIENRGLKIMLPTDPQVGKRVTRLMRKSYAFGYIPEDQVSWFEEGYKNQWDGMNLVSDLLVHNFINDLPSEIADKYIRAQRFEITAQAPYQIKGHAMVWPQWMMDKHFGKGTLLAAPVGSDKQQIAYQRPEGGVFVDLRPVSGHNYLTADIQTIINHYHPILSNEQLEGWLAEEAQSMIQGIQSGRLEQRYIESLFSDVYDESEFVNKLDAMPIYEFLASGGQLNESPYMMKQFANMYRDKAQGRMDKMRFPIPGGFRLYIANQVASPNPDVRDMDLQGGVIADFERGTLWVSDKDYLGDSEILGGDDQDDAVNGLANREGFATLSRSPNAMGERVLRKLMNYHELAKHNVYPMDIDFGPLENITKFHDKRFKYNDDNPLPRLKTLEGLTTYQEYSQAIIESASQRIAVLGQYINTLSSYTLRYGKEPIEQIAPSEMIIDAVQKNLDLDISPVLEWMEELAEGLTKEPAAADAQRRLRGVLSESYRKKKKRLSFRNAEGHWLDDLQSRMMSVVEDMTYQVWEMADMASPPESVLKQIGSGDLGQKLSDVYWGTLHEFNKPYPNAVWDLASENAAEYLQGLSIEDRTQSVLQALLHPVSSSKHLNDKWLFSDSLKGYTFDAMRRVGWLSVGMIDPTSAEYSPPDRSVSSTLLTRGSMYFAAQRAIKGRDPNRLGKGEMAGLYSATEKSVGNLVDRSFQILTGRIPGSNEAGKLIVDETGKTLGAISGAHFGSYENLLSGKISAASLRHGNLALSISDAIYQSEGDVGSSFGRERLREISENYFEYARSILSGDETIADLPPAMRKTVDYVLNRLQSGQEVAKRIEGPDLNDLGQRVANYLGSRTLEAFEKRGQPLAPVQFKSYWRHIAMGIKQGTLDLSQNLPNLRIGPQGENIYSNVIPPTVIENIDKSRAADMNKMIKYAVDNPSGGKMWPKLNEPNKPTTAARVETPANSLEPTLRGRSSMTPKKHRGFGDEFDAEPGSQINRIPHPTSQSGRGKLDVAPVDAFTISKRPFAAVQPSAEISLDKLPDAQRYLASIYRERRIGLPENPTNEQVMSWLRQIESVISGGQSVFLAGETAKEASGRQILGESFLKNFSSDPAIQELIGSGLRSIQAGGLNLSRTIIPEGQQISEEMIPGEHQFGEQGPDDVGSYHESILDGENFYQAFARAFYDETRGQLYGVSGGKRYALPMMALMTDEWQTWDPDDPDKKGMWIHTDAFEKLEDATGNVIWERSDQKSTSNEPRVPPALGGGGGMDKPPDAPFFFSEPDEFPEDPGHERVFFDPDRQTRPGLEQKVMEDVAAGHNFIMAAPTGSGKTNMMLAAFSQGAVEKQGGLGIVLTPLNKISSQHEAEFNKYIGHPDEQNAFFLPGHPGKGASPDAVADYENRRDRFLNMLGLGFDESGNVTVLAENDPNTGSAIPRGRIAPKEGGGYKWVGSPAAVIMSGTKFANAKDTQIGRVLSFLANNDLINSVLIDEGDTLFDLTNEAGRYIKDAVDYHRINAPIGFFSGSFTPQQIKSLQSQFNIPSSAITVVPADPNSRVTWKANQSTKETGPQLLADAISGEQPAIIFPQRIDKFERTADAVADAGLNPVIYHADKRNPLTAEQKAAADELLTNGVPVGDVLVASSAIGAGVNRPELGEAAIENPYDMRDLTQKAGRIREPKEGQLDRSIEIDADPGEYFRRATRISKTADRLLDPNYLGKLYSEVYRGGPGYNQNWQIASQQMQDRISKTLYRDKLHSGLASNVLSWFREAGLINLTQKSGSEGEGFLGWEFTAQGGSARVAEILSNATVRSVLDFDPETGKPREIPLNQRIREDTGYLKREQMAMGRLFNQALGNTSSPEEAGSIIRSGVKAMHEGGLEGLENFVNVELPQSLSKKFNDAVESATKKLEETSRNAGDMNEAMDGFREEVGKAKKNIAGNPAAAQYASEEAAARARGYYAAGNRVAGDAFSAASGSVAESINQGTPGGAPPFDETGRGPTTQKGGSNWKQAASRAVLYSLFADRRLWQYTIGAELQQAIQIDDWAMPAMFGQGIDYGRSMSGFRSRYAAGQEFLAQGSFQQVGAFAELPYAISGFSSGDNIARAMSTARIGAGVAGIGLSSGAMISLINVPAGLTIAGASAVAGASVAGLGGAAEISNYLYGRRGRDAITLDNLVRNTALGMTVLPQFITGNGEQAVSALENLKTSNPQWYNFIMYQGQTPQEARVQELAERIATNTPGATAQQYTSIMAQMGRYMGGTLGNEGRLEGFFRAGARLGYQPEEFASTYLGIAQQMGYLPGSSQYQDLMGRLSGASSPAEIAQIQSDAQRTANFSSQLAYYVGGYQASDIVNTYGIDRPSEASALQRAYAQYEAAGLDLNKVVRTDLVSGKVRRTTRWTSPEGGPVIKFNPAEGEYKLALKTPSEEVTTSRWEDALVEKDITFADALAEIQQKYPDYGSQIFNFATGTGGAALSAFGLGEQDILGVVDAMGAYFQGKGYTPHQMGLAAQSMSNLQAASYTAWRYPNIISDIGKNVQGSRLWDLSGNPIYETNGSAFVQMIQSQAASGNLAAQRISGYNSLFGTGMIGTDIAASMGIQPNRMQTYMASGVRGVTEEIRNEIYQNQLAQAGIGLGQIANTRAYYWGSGSWDDPSTGSMWYLEDRQRALQHRSQMASFSATWQRMELGQQHAIAQENLSEERMNVSQGYQEWALQFDRIGQLLQRQFQDQTRALQWQWKTEDYGEEARFLTGRQRRLAERDMKRATIMHNLEEEQIDVSRAREDERYKKSSEYSKRMMELDREQFELNKKHREESYRLEVEEFQRRKKEYLEQKAIQDEMVQLSRKHQADQLAFQASSAALSLENLKKQKELEEITRKNNQNWSDIKGELELINSYDSVVPIMSSVKAMLEQTKGVDPALIQKITDLIDKLSNFTPAGGSTQEIVVNIGNDQIKRYIIDTITGEVSFR